MIGLLRHPVFKFASASLVAALVVGLHLLTIVVVQMRALDRQVAAGALNILASALATGALYYAARQTSPRNRQAGQGWFLLALAQLMTVLGDTAWLLIATGLLRWPPFPSPATIFVVGFYLLFGAGLWRMARVLPPRPAAAWARSSIDAAIITLSGMLALWVWLLAPNHMLLARDLLMIAIPLASLLANLCLFGILAVLIAYWRTQLAIWFLVAAVASSLVTGSLFWRQAAVGAYVSGGYLDLGRTLTSILFGLAGMAQAWIGAPKPTRDDDNAGERHPRYLAYAGLIGGYILLLLYHDRAPAINLPLLALGFGLVIILVLVRQALALDENVRLHKAQQAEIERRRRVEGLLEEERNLLRTVIDTLPGALFVIDRAGCYTLVNRAHVQLLGATSEREVIGKDAQDYFSPDVAAAYLSREQMLLLTGSRLIDHEELVVSPATGERRWYTVSEAPLYDRNGLVTGLVGIGHDVTEQKRSQEAERSQRALAEALRDSAAALTSSLSFDVVIEQVMANVGRVVAHDCVNVMLIEGDIARAVACRGYDRLGVQDDVLAERFRVAEVANLRHMMTTDEPIAIPNTADYPGWVRNDNTAWIRSYAGAPISLRGKVIGFLNLDSQIPGFYAQEDAGRLRAFADQAAIAIENARLFTELQQELVERRQAELELERERASLARRVDERTVELLDAADRLRAANAELAAAAHMKDEFLASMSHELRTPLAALLIHAQTLLEGVYGELGPRQRRSVAAIEEAGNHLLVLINNLLDLAKIGAGKLQLLIDVVDVADLCQAVLGQVADAAGQKGLQVCSSIDPGVQLIQADDRRLKQILANLLSNAMKFTPTGGAIGLDVQGDAALGLIYFAVWDTGIGIAPEDMGRLFQQFVQLDGSLSRRYEGAGLGLLLAYRLTVLHGGDITVQSAPGEGSRFTVSLPWKIQQ